LHGHVTLSMKNALTQRGIITQGWYLSGKKML